MNYIITQAHDIQRSANQKSVSLETAEVSAPRQPLENPKG
jgi:hypothetical protein